MGSVTATLALMTGLRRRNLFATISRVASFVLSRGSRRAAWFSGSHAGVSAREGMTARNRTLLFRLTTSQIAATLLCLGALLVPRMSFSQEGPLAALQKKYPITQTTLDRDQIADPGIVMEVEAHGINAQPWGGLLTFDNPIVDGKVQQRSSAISGLRMLGAGMKNLHILEPGEKVYVTKIEVKGDTLRMVILTCDKIDVAGEDGQRRYSAGLSFRFPKDAMAQSSPDELEHTIEQVIAPSKDDGQESGNQQSAASAAPAPAPPPPAAPTATIAIGQTTEQVIAAMGLPLQVIDLGSKKTYKYKDLKILFVNNKVTDVQ